MIPIDQAEYEQRVQSYETELADLRDQAATLEEEVASLRRRLQDAPKRVRTLEERLLETKGQLAQAVSQNEKLTYTLREAREHIAALRDEVDKLTQPPSAYGVIVGKNDDGTVDILTSGRKMKVATHPDIDTDQLDRGSEVVLNESFNVVSARAPEATGEVVYIKEVMEDGTRVIVVGRADIGASGPARPLVYELAQRTRVVLVLVDVGGTALSALSTGGMLEQDWSEDLVGLGLRVPVVVVPHDPVAGRNGIADLDRAGTAVHLAWARVATAALELAGGGA